MTVPVALALAVALRLRLAPALVLPVLVTSNFKLSLKACTQAASLSPAGGGGYAPVLVSVQL